MKDPAAVAKNRVHPNLNGGRSAQAADVLAKQGARFSA